MMKMVVVGYLVFCCALTLGSNLHAVEALVTALQWWHYLLMLL